MTRRDLGVRATGAVSLAASWGTCLWLRALMAERPHQPTLLQAGLVLASFVLSLAGLLLLLNGARLLGASGTRNDIDPTAPAEPDSLAVISLVDDRAARSDALTRRAMRCRGAKRDRR